MLVYISIAPQICNTEEKSMRLIRLLKAGIVTAIATSGSIFLLSCGGMNHRVLPYAAMAAGVFFGVLTLLWLDLPKTPTAND
jgi:hypothetical protein